MFKQIIALGMALALCACQGAKTASTQGADSLESNSSVVYKGTLPCADCSGIEVALTLEGEGKALYSTYYIGRSDTAIVERGHYTLSDSTLTLILPADTLNFVRSGERLTYLNYENKPFEGSLAPYYHLYQRRAFDYVGEYSLAGAYVEGGYRQMLSISPEGEGYRLKFSASLIKGKEGCSLSALGTLRGDTLFVPLAEPHKGQTILLYPRHDDLGLEVAMQRSEDRHSLMWYCSGGGSLAGSYLKTGITAEGMSVFRRGDSLQDLFRTVPMAQIEHAKVQGEFADDVYDDYEVSTPEGELLFTLTPKGLEEGKQIQRIHIISPLYRTAEGINSRSTWGDIKRAYPQYEAEPTEGHIVVSVAQLNAEFVFLKSQFAKDWWDAKAERVDLSKLPDTARAESLFLWWSK